MVGLHRSVTLSFMLVGHTKFSPDWCFGLFKRRYKRTFVSSLQDIATVVSDGTVEVPVYNWADFFSGRFRKVQKITTYHHFSFSSSTPGVVSLKEYSDTEPSSCCFLLDTDWAPSATELPAAIPPSGLSLQRQWYLHKEIREFCRPGTEDLVCPLPATLLEDQPVQPLQPERCVSTAPPAKRPRCCGLHGAPGHTRQTCSRRHN